MSTGSIQGRHAVRSPALLGLIPASPLDACCYRQVPLSVIQRLIEHRANVGPEQGGVELAARPSHDSLGFSFWGVAGSTIQKFNAIE